MRREFWCGKRVFLTGHTGFKGSWLSLWLSDMGAIVFGYSLDASTTPNLFADAQIRKHITQHTIGDIRDSKSLISAIQIAQPEIVFHLAAQSLVRESYVHPVKTYETNIMGTINLFEAIRKIPNIRVVVNVTSDKCYKNLEQDLPYSENDVLGGYDPYSSSKACSEILTAAYRNSFLSAGDTFVASARAGNVIGGGDWAADRLIPDFFRATNKRKAIEIRSPNSIRPWQHVLEPLSGYLTLAEHLYVDGKMFAEAWNFGPTVLENKPVSWIVEYLCKKVPNSKWVKCPIDFQLHEAAILKLNSSKANEHLKWFPRWNLQTALNKTIEWYQNWKAGSSVPDLTLRQIYDYENSGNL